MKNQFLFELGLEEIPADMIVPALEQMRGNLTRQLEAEHISYQEVRSYAGPRRLALLVHGLPDHQPDREELVSGPPYAVAYDEKGQPTPALKGFARKVQTAPEDLQIIETEKGRYLGYQSVVHGRALPEILGEILSRLMEGIQWPKNMYWTESRFRFIRPIRWLLALWNDQVVPFEFEGIQAGRDSRGHRFLGQASVPVQAADEYLDVLRRNFVLADVEERRTKILGEIDQVLPAGLKLFADPQLMESVLYLNEYPSVICGSFAEEFLQLPGEVLVTVMRHHQKYFSVVDQEEAIQPRFVTVLNTDGDPENKIRGGHEKVLKARLEDANFFWKGDRKRSLEERLTDLDDVLFQQKLGSYREKTERIQAICRELSGEGDLDTAARLCKVDLATDMVRELTDLQGTMGGLYAREEGYPEQVWKAIYEHYHPLSGDDPSPASRMGALLSVADKLDSVVGCFLIGISPTGSSDPFALRRQAQGLVKVLLDHQLDFRLEYLVEKAEANFKNLEVAPGREAVLDFLWRRVRHLLEAKGFSYDVLNAVLSARPGGVHDAFRRARSLADIKGEADFEALAAAYKRTRNILKDQPIELGSVDVERLTEPEEQSLYQEYRVVEPEVDNSLGQGDYDAALRSIASLRGAVDRFFDKVLVMAEDAGLRQNRLRLLHDISDLTLRIADISEIVQPAQAEKAD